MGQLVSVVFSFRNESAVLPELIERTTAAMAGLAEDRELIFVDDDSSDGSLELLLERRRTDPTIKVLRMSRRFGVAECLLAGLEHAKGDAVIYLDADLQDPPELIPRLVERWRAGADVVHTRRTRRLGESQFKRWLTLSAYRFINWMSTIELPLECGDYKLISRRVARELVALRETDPYVRGLAVWVGFRQEYVEYERQARTAGESHFPILASRNPLKHFVSGITSFSFAPIYAVIAAGLAGTAASLFAAAAGCAARAGGGGWGPAGWLAVLAVFLWSTLLLAIGTVGIYVLRTYKDGRGRPRYIVRETHGVE